VIWIGTRGRGVMRVERGRFGNTASRKACPAAWSTPSPQTTGGLWIGTNGGLGHLIGERIETFTVRDGLPRNAVMALVLDRDGNLWVGTQGGLARLRGRRLAALTEREGLADDDVRALLEDHEGNVWAAPRRPDEALGRPFTTYGRTEGLLAGPCERWPRAMTGASGSGPCGGRCQPEERRPHAALRHPFEGRNVLCLFEDRSRRLWWPRRTVVCSA